LSLILCPIFLQKLHQPWIRFLVAHCTALRKDEDSNKEEKQKDGS
jgi:hypothetical protein